jgi:septum formation initiator
MKIAAAVVLFLVMIFLGVQVYSFFGQERTLDANLADIQLRLTNEKSDEADLENEVQYLSNPINLEKELRARFNYKKPGETMIIIVPSATSTGTD